MTTKRYEDKIYHNLSTQELEIKSTFVSCSITNLHTISIIITLSKQEHMPRFGGTGDASDTYYMKAILANEKDAISSAKQQEDEEIAQFRVKSYTRPIQSNTPSILPITATSTKQTIDPIKLVGITIKAKKRKINTDVSSSSKRSLAISETALPSTKIPKIISVPITDGNNTSKTPQNSASAAGTTASVKPVTSTSSKPHTTIASTAPSALPVYSDDEDESDS